MSADIVDGEAVDERGWREPVEFLDVSVYDGHLGIVATVSASDLYEPTAGWNPDPQAALAEFGLSFGRARVYLSHEQAQRLHEQLAAALRQAHDATHTEEPA